MKSFKQFLSEGTIRFLARIEPSVSSDLRTSKWVEVQLPVTALRKMNREQMKSVITQLVTDVYVKADHKIGTPDAATKQTAHVGDVKILDVILNTLHSSALILIQSKEKGTIARDVVQITIQREFD